MASCATVDDTRVRHQRSRERCEVARGMAGLAWHIGRQMVHRFGFRRHTGKALAVVATCAITENSGVRHNSGTGPKSSMASRTYLRRRQVSDRRGSQARHQKGRRRSVAARAIQRGHHMRCRRIRLGLWRHTHKALAVVAARAIIDDTGVVHQRSGKSTWIGFTRRMAYLARHAGRQMG